MRDQIERLLKHVPDRVPSAPEAVSARVRERVLSSMPSLSGRRGGVLLIAAVVLVGGVAFAAGYWTGPTQAAADLTIGVRPDTVSLELLLKQQVTLFGTVPTGRAGDSVQIEANECGLSGQFHELKGVRTEGQGVWSLQIAGGPVSNIPPFIDTKTMYRARWNGRTSDTVTVNVRSYVQFRQFPPPKGVKLKPGKRFFWIGVIGRQMKYRPRVIVERRVGDEWSTVAKPIIDRVSVRMRWLPAAKGQLLRVRLPDSEASPCYLGAVSPALRVR